MSAPPPIRPRLGIIPEHNGIRGLGASIVIIAHVFMTWHFAIAPVLMDLFFIYSAFFVTRIFLNTELSRENFQVFYIRRAIRIWPLYYAVIIPCLILEHVMANLNLGLAHQHDLYEWLQFLTFFQFMPEYAERYAIGSEYLLSHTWSLAIEEQFYITWPPLLLILIRHPRLTAPVLTTLFAIAAFSATHGIGSKLYLTRLDDFAIGTATAFIAHRPHWEVFKRKVSSERVLIGVAAGSAMICLLLSVGILIAVPINAQHTLSIGFDDNRLIGFIYKVLFATMIPAVSATAAHPLWRPARWRVLVALGQLAYPLYLIHYPILLLTARVTHVAWGWGHIQSGIISVPLTVAASYLWYRVIDLPAEQRRRNYAYQSKQG